MKLVTKINFFNKILMNGGIFIQILIWGQDPRFKVLETELKIKHDVDLSNDLNVDIKKYDMIILPMKGVNDKEKIELLKNSREDVIIYTGLKNNLEKLNRNIVSFLDDGEIKEANNNITVDGIIDYVKKNKSDKICLLGYGNIGKKIYQRLQDKIVGVGIIKLLDKIELGDIAFYTSDYMKMIQALNNSDLVINTVPENIITDQIAEFLDTKILDIASSPYGVSKKVVDKYNLDYYLYSGIPGKYDPNKAGKILLKKIKR